MSAVDFLLSNYFVPFWIMVAALVFFVPFGIVGLRNVIKWIDFTFLKPKKGFVLGRQKMANDRLREFWLFPVGKTAMFPTVDGEKISMPLKLEKGWIAFEGNLPVIEFDKDNQQMSFENRNAKGQISQEEITAGYKYAYDTGKMTGMTDFLASLKVWFLIILAISAVTAGVSLVLGYMNKSAISNLHIPTGDELYQAMINSTYKYQNATIPHV